MVPLRVSTGKSLNMCYNLRRVFYIVSVKLGAVHIKKMVKITAVQLVRCTHIYADLVIFSTLVQQQRCRIKPVF